MKKNLRYAFILFSICAVCAFALGWTNSVTAPVIAQAEKDNELSALTAVAGTWSVGDRAVVEGVSYVQFSVPLTDDDQVKGYILGLKGAGYAGDLTLVASYTLEGEMLFAKMLTNNETPGLGKKSEEEGYMDMFKGTGAIKPIPTTKDMLAPPDVAAVSGSTVTFMAIGKAIEGGSTYVKTLGGSL